MAGYWMSVGLSLIMGYWVCRSLNLEAAAASSCNYSSQTCGGLSIPYPFGMSSECGLPGYRISCKLNSSYGEGLLPFLQVGTGSTAELQVLNFSTNTITVSSTQLKAMPTPPNCEDYAEASFDLSSSGPFVLADDNLFAVIGCRSEGSCVASSSDPHLGNAYTIQCSTGCYNEFDFRFCNAYACCVNAIPPGSRHLRFKGKGISYAAFPNVCGFSTVLSPSTYNVATNQYGTLGAGQYGLLISWALILSALESCSTVKDRSDYACSEMAECLDVSRVPGYTCHCSEGYRGDGYRHGIGCQDIDECAEGLDNCEPPPLGMCTNTVGSYNCSCTSGVGTGLPGNCTIKTDDVVLPAGNCTTIVHDKTDVVLPAVLGVVAGAFILSVLIIVVWGSRRAYRLKREREINFHWNGGEGLWSMLFSEDDRRTTTSEMALTSLISDSS